MIYTKNERRILKKGSGWDCTEKEGEWRRQDRYAVSWVSAADRFRLGDMSYDDKKWESNEVVN